MKYKENAGSLQDLKGKEQRKGKSLKIATVSVALLSSSLPEGAVQWQAVSSK